MGGKRKKIRWQVLLPPWITVMVLLLLNLADYDSFVAVMDGTIGWILEKFAWMLDTVSLAALVLVTIAYFSPIRNVRIGGSRARPVIKYTNYVWIVLCTIMGAGLMLWACAEPVTHIHNPPVNVTQGPLSGEAILWAMENIFLEWTFTPMAIYAIVGIMFAFVFYNMRGPFSIGSMLISVLGKRVTDRWLTVLDSVCLFCICLGMASTLGSGILLVIEGVVRVTGGAVAAGTWSWGICGAVIIICFTLSASSGLKKGMKHLSTLNSWFYLIIGIFIFLAGPTSYILNLSTESFGAYISDFFKLSLWTSISSGDGWSLQWPQFYWCMWFTWMPLFSSTSIKFELDGAGIGKVMETNGIAAAAYEVLEHMPLAVVIVPLFLLTAFMSYVTSADSNTNAMASLCTVGLSEVDTESPVGLKIFWGTTVGALCLIMLTAFNINGMKMLADLGGFFSSILMILFMAAAVAVIKDPARFDRHGEDYDEKGRPRSSIRLPVEGEGQGKKRDPSEERRFR